MRTIVAVSFLFTAENIEQDNLGGKRKKMDDSVSESDCKVESCEGAELNESTSCDLDIEGANELLKKTVSLDMLVKERAKRVKEFNALGAEKRRAVTNLANEMRLRAHFIGVPLRNLIKKKAWAEIRLVRDIFSCCKKMLRVFIEDKLKMEFFTLKSKNFGLGPTADSIVNEVSFACYQIHSKCEDMSNENLCLLYRVCLYVLPKFKIIGQPTLEDEVTLRAFIDIQHM